MTKGTPTEVTRTCFVVMGFGKKTDFETGRTLDLDKSYRNIIKPAVEAAGQRATHGAEHHGDKDHCRDEHPEFGFVEKFHQPGSVTPVGR